MILPPTLYFGIWGTALLAWLALSYEYYEKWQEQLEEVGDDIRTYNAQQGYDQSVGRENLAKDLRNPLKSGNIQKFVENNNLVLNRYTAELHENVGNPVRLFWAMGLHLFGLFYTLTGILYLAPLRLLSPSIYLILSFGLLTISLVFYLYI